MARFNQLVSAYQIHAVGWDTVVLNERMVLDNRLDIFCTLRLGRLMHFFAVFHAPFHENRQGGGTHDPMVVV